MIDKDHQEKFIELWEKGKYRQGSTAQRFVPRLMEIIPPEATVNDYGCGTGRAEVVIHQIRPDQKITMIDITQTAVEAEAKALIDAGVYQFIEADFCDLSEVPMADWGMCINVLMTVQADKLDLILFNIKNTCKNLIVEVYERPDVRLGRDNTTVKMSMKQWKRKLEEYWPDVAYEPSPETASRYVYICRGDL